MTDISQPEEAFISIEDQAAAATQVQGMVASAGLNIEYDTDDAISLSDDHENHTVGLKDPGNFDMDGVYTRARAILFMGQWRAPNRTTFEVVYGPEGSTAGMEELTFETFMTGFEISCDDGSTTSMSTKHKVTGEVVTSTF